VHTVVVVNMWTHSRLQIPYVASQLIVMAFEKPITNEARLQPADMVCTESNKQAARLAGKLSQTKHDTFEEPETGAYQPQGRFRMRP
jgi:hypothetical protein